MSIIELSKALGESASNLTFTLKTLGEENVVMKIPFSSGKIKFVYHPLMADLPWESKHGGLVKPKTPLKLIRTTKNRTIKNILSVLKNRFRNKLFHVVNNPKCPYTRLWVEVISDAVYYSLKSGDMEYWENKDYARIAILMGIDSEYVGSLFDSARRAFNREETQT